MDKAQLLRYEVALPAIAVATIVWMYIAGRQETHPVSMAYYIKVTLFVAAVVAAVIYVATAKTDAPIYSGPPMF